MSILLLTRKLILKVEKESLAIKYLVYTFISVFALRTLLELFSDRSGINFINFSEYLLFWVNIFLLITIILFLACREKIGVILKILIYFSPVIWLAPIIDLIVSRGRGIDIAYLVPYLHGSLINRYLHFFGDFNGSGVSIGIKVEIGIIMLLIFLYLLAKTAGYFKAIISIIFIYTLIFLYFASPYFISWVLNIWQTVSLESLIESGEINYIQIQFHLVLNFCILLTLFFLYNKKYFKAIIRDLRFFRVLHFLLMLIFGLKTAKIVKFNFIEFPEASIILNNIFCYLLIVFSLILAWVYSVIGNNIIDIEIDNVSNQERPLITKAITENEYRFIAGIVLVAALVYALSVSFRHLFLILVFLGAYYIYSMPPLRLKRVLFFSKIIPALNSLVAAMLGFFFFFDNILYFPPKAIFYILVFFTLAMNFIDIKDYQGDKAVGIKTLPSVLGLAKSKMLIGAFFVSAYIGAIYLFELSGGLIYLMLFLGVLQFYFINRKKYSEKPVFFTYFITMWVILNIIK